MKKIICMSGPSGAGKTYARLHDPALENLPQLDIMDIYLAHPTIKPTQAFRILMRQVQELLGKHDTIVLEAYFRPKSRQRIILEWIAEGIGAEVEYRELNTPLDICRQRVLADAEAAARNAPDDPAWRVYRDIRLKLLDLIEEE